MHRLLHRSTVRLVTKLMLVRPGYATGAPTVVLATFRGYNIPPPLKKRIRWISFRTSLSHDIIKLILYTNCLSRLLNRGDRPPAECAFLRLIGWRTRGGRLFPSCTLETHTAS